MTTSNRGTRGRTSVSRSRSTRHEPPPRPRSAPGRSRSKPVSKPEAPPSQRFRLGAGRVGLFGALALAICQLFWIQGVNAAQLSAQSAGQRTVQQSLPALRGSITDHNGKLLAFTTEARSLHVQPVAIRKQLAAVHAKNPAAPTPGAELQAIATAVHHELGDAASEADLLTELRSNDLFAYLAHRVDPAVADRIVAKFPGEVGADREEIRQYPGGSLAANLIGGAGWDGHGLIGLEASMDAQLAGTDGSETYDRSSDGIEIPGSRRNHQPAVDGQSVELTLDSDLQYYVQQQVQQAKELSLARGASAVVLDAKTGQVLAMANDNTFNPAMGPQYYGQGDIGDRSVMAPFEPGSVNKVVTAAAAIEYHLTTPDEVWQVPGSIDMAGVRVHDAWDHGLVPYTTTGIFGHSSNVGTLMLSQRIGEDRYADMLRRFGLGRRTDVGLPGESPGEVPARDQWSGGTFANLPIGQGLSMTLLQMTSMYQAIANDGLRMPPRIIASVSDSSGAKVPTPRPAGVRVVSAETARTLRDMFQAVTQHSSSPAQTGTGPSAAVDGYRIAGKTGTAQQVDPHCKCYSNSKYWITFAGIAPADNPRYVVGMMLDAPSRSSDGSGGESAGPLFHNIASWMLQRDGVPLSSEPAKQLILEQM